jgi:lambda family phage portal protein
MSFLKVVDSRGNPIPSRALESAYEGAATGRRMNTWGLSSSGPNTNLFSSLRSLRSRSRTLIRNNPLADGAVGTWAANVIGSGISPRWLLKDKELKKQIQELWNDWVDESDHYGICSFYGQQAQGARAMLDAGEFLGRMINVDPEEGLSVPLQIQLLEADHLDETYNTMANNGNEVRMGIEIDRAGRRVAYWLWKDHPGEAFISSRYTAERVRIPAEDIVHVFDPLRIGQMRGRPGLTSIIVRLHEIDQYDDAELVRKKTAALFGGFIIDNPHGIAAGEAVGRSIGDDINGSPVVAIEPGTFPVLPFGKTVEFSQPVDVGQTYDVWMRQQLRESAQGAGLTYEQFTGDLSNVNYSSIRAGLLEFRRRMMLLQFNTFVFQFCRPIARRWLDVAVLSDALTIDGYFSNRRIFRRIKWRPDGWPWVDPVKDQLAEQMSVRNGFKSRSRVIAERGDDVETVDAEIKEDNDRADELGLVFDSDPRRTSASGSIQKAIDETIQSSLNNEPKKKGE